MLTKEFTKSYFNEKSVILSEISIALNERNYSKVNELKSDLGYLVKKYELISKLCDESLEQNGIVDEYEVMREYEIETEFGFNPNYLD